MWQQYLSGQAIFGKTHARYGGLFHYRNLDVSSIKELAKRWRPDLVPGFKKKNTHKALDDIRESIDELKYFRETFLKIEKEK